MKKRRAGAGVAELHGYLYVVGEWVSDVSLWCICGVTWYALGYRTKNAVSLWPIYTVTAVSRLSRVMNVKIVNVEFVVV